MGSSLVRPIDHHYADSVAADRLWEALSTARAEQSHEHIADLEDAVFESYLPMATALADRVGYDTAAEEMAAQRAAELGLAMAVIDWRHPTTGGFRRFARASILRHLLNR